jgi:hypothetical protein
MYIVIACPGGCIRVLFDNQPPYSPKKEAGDTLGQGYLPSPGSTASTGETKDLGVG